MTVIQEISHCMPINLCDIHCNSSYCNILYLNAEMLENVSYLCSVGMGSLLLGYTLYSSSLSILHCLLLRAFVRFFLCPKSKAAMSPEARGLHLLSACPWKVSENWHSHLHIKVLVFGGVSQSARELIPWMDEAPDGGWQPVVVLVVDWGRVSTSASVL